MIDRYYNNHQFGNYTNQSINQASNQSSKQVINHQFGNYPRLIWRFPKIGTPKSSI
jgi:hypothetical protein